ncbi:MAG TPA: hypothetical protein VGP82_15915, partial [Ktedonobacterales bacterium]|nr:hypothetical protein [Ktedonobacterales bacterium]
MEQKPDENAQDEREAMSAPVDEVRGGAMDAETPVENPAEGHSDISDEIEDLPEQPTFVTSAPLAQSSRAASANDEDVDDDGGEAEHDAITQDDLLRPPAAYGQVRPRVQREMLAGNDAGPDDDERRPPNHSRPVKRPAPMPRPSGAPPRMPRGWQPMGQQPGIRPRGYPTPRLAQPANAPIAAANAWGPTTITITANTAAGFSYLFWWVSGLLVY